MRRMAAPIFDTFVSPYPDFGVPTLLAWSELDRRIMPDVGHLPMFDDPALVAHTMLVHLDGATAATGS